MKIVFPEYTNPAVQSAISRSAIEAIPATSLEEACQLLGRGEADALIAGIDHSTRDVILACRDYLGAVLPTFSASCYFEKPGAPSYLIADTAACKNPSEEQLYDICLASHTTALKLFPEPRLALLSFSTKGSGGHDPGMTKIQTVVGRLHEERPDIIVDGEMQLDCAIDPRIGQKKAPGSPVAGQANVLICPDLNTGNILYKSLEHFAGYRAAGPILQGFAKPVSDLSRGSSAEDILLTIKVMEKIAL